MSNEDYTENEQNIEENVEETEVADENVGKRFVHKKRRERLVRKGRMKQERTHSFIRVLLSVCLIIGFWYLSKAYQIFAYLNIFMITKIILIIY